MGAGLTTMLAKAFKAEAAISRRRIVKFGSTDDLVVQAAAAADAVFGVATHDLDSAVGETCDVIVAGVAEVDFGANITRGQLLMADANGRAVAAAAAAGTNVRTIGVAMVSGVSGDVGVALIQPGSFQG